MKPTIETLKAYLAEHPQKYSYPDIHSLLDALFWDYIECNPLSSDALRSGLQAAEKSMEKLNAKEMDRVLECFYLFCGEHQRLAFIAGAQVGSRLTLELTET